MSVALNLDTSPSEDSDRSPNRFAEQQLRALVDQIPAVVWTADTEDRFTFAMGSAAATFAERRGTGYVEDRTFSPGPNDLALGSAFERALLGERTSYLAAWGEQQFECTVVPMYDHERIVGAIGVAFDSTERRRTEREVAAANEEAVTCMVRAIELRDAVTGTHILRIGDYCAILANAIGLHPSESHAIAIASRLHDVGKIVVPDEILLKPTLLTQVEREVIQRHCVIGHEILGKAESPILRLGGDIALTHHEWFDGTGYPHGLAGQAIPLAGRIVAIADVFDALTSDRSYRDALCFDNACELMRCERGTHFDPELLDLFLGSDAVVQTLAAHSHAASRSHNHFSLLTATERSLTCSDDRDGDHNGTI